MKHIQNCAKSTSLLNDTLAVFSMKKVHLMTFCPTCTSYLLDSCLKAVELFIPLCDILTTIGIKKEETDSFLAPKNLFIMHNLADLQPVFNKYLLRAVGKDDGIIINTFRLNKGLSQEFECTKLKSFVEGLSVDDKGNVVCSINANNDKHTMQLNYNHCPSRLTNLSKLEIRTHLAGTLKETILSNVIENINSQSQTDTIIEFSSTFDLNLTIGLDERKELLKKLCSVFCVNYVYNKVPPERGYSD